jgi:hypothetical protein
MTTIKKVRDDFFQMSKEMVCIQIMQTRNLDELAEVFIEQLKLLKIAHVVGDRIIENLREKNDD